MKTENIMERYIQYMYSYPHKTAYRKLENIFLSDYRMYLRREEKNDLYFHIPFCESKCGYCNLFSVSGEGEYLTEKYIEAMERQAETYDMKKIPFQTLTIGGGTPLYLSAKQLEKVFQTAKNYFKWEIKKPEIIIETSPRQTTEEKVAILKEQQVTRVSIGVQSFQEKELQILHRNHTKEEIKKALELLKKAEFTQLNLDLIYGIPEQTKETLKNNIDCALFYEPEELFVYPLYVKPQTRLFREGVKREEDAYESYCFSRDYLKQRGYEQTSMRRFVRKDKFCLEEKAEWKECGYSENTISIGCGGRSYIGNLHFCSPYAVKPSHCKKIVQDYIDTKDFQKIEYGFLLSEEERKRRYLIKNLFYFRGVSSMDYRENFHGELKIDFPILDEFIEKNYIKEISENLVLTPLGLGLSDYLGPMFISEEVKERMKRWTE